MNPNLGPDQAPKLPAPNGSNHSEAKIYTRVEFDRALQHALDAKHAEEQRFHTKYNRETAEAFAYSVDEELHKRLTEAGIDYHGGAAKWRKISQLKDKNAAPQARIAALALQVVERTAEFRRLWCLEDSEYMRLDAEQLEKMHTLGMGNFVWHTYDDREALWVAVEVGRLLGQMGGVTPATGHLRLAYEIREHWRKDPTYTGKSLKFDKQIFYQYGGDEVEGMPERTVANLLSAFRRSSWFARHQTRSPGDRASGRNEFYDYHRGSPASHRRPGQGQKTGSKTEKPAP